jgi:hypothetical protein
MRIDMFTIPALDATEATAELNRHLSSTRILTVDRQFVADGANSYWSICVMSETGPAKRPDAGRKTRIDCRKSQSADA